MERLESQIDFKSLGKKKDHNPKSTTWGILQLYHEQNKLHSMKWWWWWWWWCPLCTRPTRL